MTDSEGLAPSLLRCEVIVSHLGLNLSSLKPEKPIAYENRNLFLTPSRPLLQDSSFSQNTDILTDG